MPRRRFQAICYILGALFAASTAEAQANPSRPGEPVGLAMSNPLDALTGIRQMDVRIDFSHPPTGTDSVQARIRIESRLRQASIVVDSRAVPTLHVSCDFLTGDPITYNCRGLFTDWVYRYRPTLRRFEGELWDNGGFVASVTRRGFAAQFPKDIDGLIDAFLKDWYTANPTLSAAGAGSTSGKASPPAP